MECFTLLISFIIHSENIICLVRLVVFLFGITVSKCPAKTKWHTEAVSHLSTEKARWLFWRNLIGIVQEWVEESTHLGIFEDQDSIYIKSPSFLFFNFREKRSLWISWINMRCALMLWRLKKFYQRLSINRMSWLAVQIIFLLISLTLNRNCVIFVSLKFCGFSQSVKN